MHGGVTWLDWLYAEDVMDSDSTKVKAECWSNDLNLHLNKGKAA